MIWNISGYDVLIDDEDYERLKGFKYNVYRGDEERGLYYFSRNLYVDGKRTMTRLHRDVMGCIKGDRKTVDHINGNTLDCRKVNLRICTNTENCRNAKTHKNNTSGVKGVCWSKSSKKWQAHIRVDYIRIHLGLFTNIKDAEKAYADASAKYHGVFGRTK